MMTKQSLAVVLSAVAGGVALLWGVWMWGFCRVTVPAGMMAIVTAKSGDPLPPGEILAGPGQKGVRREPLTEGRHFLNPIAYSSSASVSSSILKSFPDLWMLSLATRRSITTASTPPISRSMSAVRFSLNSTMPSRDSAKPSVSSMAAWALDPAWTPTFPPARSASVWTGEDPFTTTTWAFLT